MVEKLNLAAALEAYLPPEPARVIREASIIAAESSKADLYLVGGIVRDMLLARPSLDFDLVVEGEVQPLAGALAAATGARSVRYSQFGTAKLRYGSFNLDVAMARRETYPRPGALPVVAPGTIGDDLFRRDFTINAMAVCLARPRFGEVLDPFGGRDDLGKELIRVLHQKSFVDDATRILRAVRYEQRLDFSLEAETLALVRRDAPMLQSISADRLRHELELMLSEEMPEKVLRRAAGLGVLLELHPSLSGNGWLAGKFAAARETARQVPLPLLYLCLLIYPLAETEARSFLAKFRFPRRALQALQDTLEMKKRQAELDRQGLTPSQVYYSLMGFTPAAVQAGILATDSAPARERMQLFLSRLRSIKTSLGGKDLAEMGIAPGPEMGRWLRLLHEARLDGRVTSRQQELQLIERLRKQ
ncbi:MAG: hypothetical protein V1737_05270 [Chloroflexota bacterium]